MSYYDPNTYNYDNLTEEDKRFMDAYRYAITVAGDKDAVEYILGIEDEKDILSQIKREVMSEVIDAITEHMQSMQTSIMVNLIEQYPDDYFDQKEQDASSRI